jgi:hypothetical protein
MSPVEAEALPDEMWGAMVRHMLTEAEALKTEQAKLPRR